MFECSTWSARRPAKLAGASLVLGAVAVSALIGSARPANATFITNGCAAANSYCTLAELTSNAAFIDINNVFFNNFQANPQTAAEIKVVPIDSAGRVGLDFMPINPSINPWKNTVDINGYVSGGFSDEFFYDVRNFGNSPLTASALSATFLVGGNLLFPTAYADSSGPVSLAVSCAQVANVYGDCNNATSQVWKPMAPTSSFGIDQIVSGSYQGYFPTPTGTVAITDLQQVFDVPEPSTLLTLLPGLAAFLVLAGLRSPLGTSGRLGRRNFMRMAG